MPAEDVVIVGAGILGIHQLYRAVQAGLTVTLLEAGGGVGGTWYWNRYPGCRFDSESYTYGYLFSEELWQEWDWSEEFAAQPETERYLNHVVDKFGLGGHIRLNSRVTSAVWDEQDGVWTTSTADAFTITGRYLVAATGVLSVPQLPDLPDRDDFRGAAYHPARWPQDPIDFTGKRVAIVGNGSSGVQIGPMIADDVAELVIYQRTANWATPLNNHPIDAEQQAYLKENFADIKARLDDSVSGFLHKPGCQGQRLPGLLPMSALRLDGRVAAVTGAEAGGQAAANYADVATVEGGASVIDTAVQEFGDIDIVVNNAGNMVWGACPRRPSRPSRRTGRCTSGARSTRCTRPGRASSPRSTAASSSPARWACSGCPTTSATRSPRRR
jgi:cation diffusion facilitator CzcD-associated flavoprotein CzcO